MTDTPPGRPNYAAPGSPEWLARRDFYLNDPGPKHWRWLSFVDPDRPKGSRLLGVSIVRAANAVEASTVAWELGCNPGGEMAMFDLPENWTPHPQFVGTLFGPDEAQRLSVFDAGTFEEKA